MNLEAFIFVYGVAVTLVAAAGLYKVVTDIDDIRKRNHPEALDVSDSETPGEAVPDSSAS